MEIQALEKMANRIRRDILTIAYKAGGPSHPGPALSIADVVTALYFEIMRVDPKNPRWPGRDRFVLSKGHACPALYAALARRGYFPAEDLVTVRRLGSYLQGHPDMGKTPGVDMTSGSLGNGLALALGMALYAKRCGQGYHSFALLGDGECQEGPVWEAALYAGAHGVGNLVAIVDYNHYQSCGPLAEILPLGFLQDKWKAFGWNVIPVNGHNMAEIVSALEVAVHFRAGPTVLVANTVKGKGVGFMEHNNAWHQKTPTEAEYLVAMRELEEADHAG